MRSKNLDFVEGFDSLDRDFASLNFSRSRSSHTFHRYGEAGTVKMEIGAVEAVQTSWQGRPNTWRVAHDEVELPEFAIIHGLILGRQVRELHVDVRQLENQ